MCWTDSGPILTSSVNIIKKKGLISVRFAQNGRSMDSQKIKQDDKIHIGANIREVRLSRKMGQTELAGRVQLMGVDMTRETLVKIERGTQHIQASQLRAIRDVLQTTYDELLK